MLPNVIVIGLGNEFRGDDILGLLVVRKLREMFGNKFIFCEHNGDGTALIELWQNGQIVFIIDAIFSNKPSGTIHRFNLVEEKLPIECFSSTHAFNIAEAVELARILDRLPSQIIFYGITSNNFELGADASTAIQQTIEKLVIQMADELNNIHI